MSQYFFAYGSFDKDEVHYSKIANFILSERKAFVKAQVFRLSCGYPMIDLSQKSSLVSGSLVELDVPETYWSILDGLLGVDMSRPDKNLFHRVNEEVLVENYSKVPCQLYCLNNDRVVHAQAIADGNWQKDMQKAPPLTKHLGDRHRDYLVKLSQTKGRDIVPIKMDLYRELLSMELIVDKGRRVALTKLGKEVSLFLK